tara:strand:- start:780 stop:1271 length:492 start_codon:yes stop_codon:yes gene_type:complete
MPYIKPLITNRWIVYNDIGDYAGLLIKNNEAYVYYNKDSTESSIEKFSSHQMLCDYFGEDITDNEIRKRSNDSGLVNKIRGYPLNFETPIMVEDPSLPLFKKSRLSNVIYCAGFYCIKGPEGWRKSFCPKRSTLISLEEWEGPFATEIEMVSVLNIKKKEYAG